MSEVEAEIPAETPDPAIARAERRLALLQELTEIGMSLARGLRDRAAGSAADKDADPADSFARISRAVRLTIALEEKIDQALRDLRAGVVRRQEEARLAAAEREEKACEQRQSTARDLVLSVAEAECGDFEEWSALAEALEERLEEDIAYETCGRWPLREIVERLCKDLTLSPDWNCWTGEGWDDTYPRHHGRLDPFREPSRRPIDCGLDDSDETAISAGPVWRRQLE